MNMMNKYVYNETVDRSFRDIMKTVDPIYENIPFGGKVIVFAGGHRQILPIVKHGNRSAIVNQCMNRSVLWKHMNIMKLSVNKRIN